MQDQHAKFTPIEQQISADKMEDREESTQTQSSSLDDVRGILDIELQANQLFNYIDKISSFADRACQNAINQTQWAQKAEESYHTELMDLRHQLELSRAALQERNIAYAVLEETTNTQRAEIEKRLGEKQTLLSQREEELKILTTEITAFIKRQQNQLEPPARLDVGPLNQEIAALKLDLVKRDEVIQAKNNALRKIEIEFRARIQELEQTVRANATSLEQQEAALKQKDALIQATAMKELEIGKLIKRLSTECERLNAELQDKNRRLAQLEGAKTPPVSEVKTWRQVVSRMQEEPT